ncbi:hypothetical protein TrRE_jg12154 [Triparma retinervis]|uniref:Uncharacterized protein n=1 Tax=Triparma retinervis TaxID=2557542 RepID=A0A9W7FWC2_9STRA|nr:hypothetical protein TrRE_jg12154 [Triparma retinervis]
MPMCTIIPPTLDDPSLPPPPHPSPWDGDCYILKPPDSCNGVGISLCNTPDQLRKKGADMGVRIIQKYLEHPYLLHLPSESALTSTPSSYKFDIRQWVIIILDASKKPKLYIWQTFYIRVCSLPFKLSGEDWNDPRRHFSNIKINDEFGGEVWGEEKFSNFVHSRGDGAKYETLKSTMHQHIKTAIRSTLHHLLHSPPMRFELLGFDFLVDKDLNPYLCEVNESPGLRRTRGGVDVSDEVEAMCHQAYDLTINKWFHSPPLPPPTKFPPFQWQRVSSFGEAEFTNLCQIWSNSVGRELAVDGSLLTLYGTSMPPAQLVKLEKTVDAPEKAIVLTRRIKLYISKYLLRRNLGLTVQRLHRGMRGRRLAREQLRRRSTLRIVRGVRKGVLVLQQRRVGVGFERFMAASNAAAVRLAFARMLEEAKVGRALRGVGKLHLSCATFNHFQRWREKVRKQQIIHRSVLRFSRNFLLRRSSARTLLRALRTFSLRLHVLRSISARNIQGWWQWWGGARRWLRRLVNLKRAHSESVLKRALLTFVRGARDRRLELLVVKYRKLEADEDRESKHREERERLRKEREGRERIKRLREEQERASRMERIRKEKEKQVDERAMATALSYSIKSVKTLKGISEHERLVRELMDVINDGEGRGEGQENEEVNVREGAGKASPPPPPAKRKGMKRKGKSKRRFDDLLNSL